MTDEVRIRVITERSAIKEQLQAAIKQQTRLFRFRLRSLFGGRLDVRATMSPFLLTIRWTVPAGCRIYRVKDLQDFHFYAENRDDIAAAYAEGRIVA